MTSELEDGFAPYANYMINYRSISRFTQLTGLSYALMWGLLEQNPEATLPPLNIAGDTHPEMSMGGADQVIKEVVEKFRWVSLEWYSKNEGVPLTTVAELAESGALGHIKVNPSSGESMIIWPPEYQKDPAAGDLPVDRKRFEIRVERTVSYSQKMNLDDPNFQSNLLRAAHTVGPSEESYDHARRAAHQSGIILQWTAFEAFLRDTVADTLRRFPEKLADSKKELGYSDLISLSGGFASIDSLKEALIEREIDSLRAGGMSVHGLINYLKKEYRFHHDPYKVSYTYRGIEMPASFKDLTKVREMRNSLVHEGAAENWDPDDLDFSAAYEKSRLLMSSIAFRLAYSIHRKKYSSDC
ncbi:hypothetical protein ACW9HR_38310 [Nocardia gipuzkoensis]